LVVVYHIPGAIYTENQYLKEFFHQFNIAFNFRMPLFFFISGYLLYHTKLRHQVKFRDVIQSRISRIVFPYLFITISLFLIKGLLPSVFNEQIDFSINGLLNIFLYPVKNPLITMWFLDVLLIFFLTVPLISLILKKKIFELIFGLLMILIAIFTPENILLFDLSTAALYYIFFYGGIIFCKYVKPGKTPFLIPVAAIILLTSYYLLDLHKIVKFAGAILLTVYLVKLIADKVMFLVNGFSSFYYQIYLFGTLAQVVVFEIIFRTGITTAWIQIPASIIGGIWIPVFISQLIMKSDINIIKLLTGFKLQKAGSQHSD